MSVIENSFNAFTKSSTTMTDGVSKKAMAPPVAGRLTQTSIELRWAPNPVATKYHLQYSKNTRFDAWKTLSNSITETSYVVDGLVPGQGYVFQLRAAYFKENIWGAFSNSSDPFFTERDPAMEEENMQASATAAMQRMKLGMKTGWSNLNATTKGNEQEEGSDIGRDTIDGKPIDGNTDGFSLEQTAEWAKRWREKMAANVAETKDASQKTMAEASRRASLVMEKKMEEAKQMREQLSAVADQSAEAAKRKLAELQEEMERRRASEAMAKYKRAELDPTGVQTREDDQEENLLSWLRGIELEQFYESLTSKAVGVESIRDVELLTTEDCEAVAMTPIQARRLMAAAKALKLERITHQGAGKHWMKRMLAGREGGGSFNWSTSGAHGPAATDEMGNTVNPAAGVMNVRFPQLGTAGREAAGPTDECSSLMRQDDEENKENTSENSSENMRSPQPTVVTDNTSTPADASTVLGDLLQASNGDKVRAVVDSSSFSPDDTSIGQREGEKKTKQKKRGKKGRQPPAKPPIQPSQNMTGDSLHGISTGEHVDNPFTRGITLSLSPATSPVTTASTTVTHTNKDSQPKDEAEPSPEPTPEEGTSNRTSTQVNNLSAPAAVKANAPRAPAPPAPPLLIYSPVEPAARRCATPRASSAVDTPKMQHTEETPLGSAGRSDSGSSEESPEGRAISRRGKRGVGEQRKRQPRKVPKERSDAKIDARTMCQPVSQPQHQIPAKIPAAPKRGSISGGEECYKIVLVGSVGVGKTNLLSTFMDPLAGYSESYSSTLKPEFASVRLPHPDGTKGKEIVLAIWDTVGQERYHAVTSSHYRRAHGAIVMYDVSKIATFEALPKWLQELKDAAGETLQNDSIMLVENKIDLLPKQSTLSKQESYREGQSFVTSKSVTDLLAKYNNGSAAGCLKHAKTTAKMNARAHEWGGNRADEVFSVLAAAIYKSQLLLKNKPNSSSGTVPLHNNLEQMKGRKKSSCC
jgi:small GTP-binding protein